METSTTHHRRGARRSALAAACAANSFRDGRWVHTPSPFPASLACSNYTFANDTCAPKELSVGGLCHSLRQTSSLLMVGDSLMLHAFLALLEFTGAKERVEPCDSNPVNASGVAPGKLSKRLPCHPCCCRAFTLPCKPRGIRIRFVRHNHLLGEFLPNPAPSVNCVSLSCRKTLGLRTTCTTWRRPGSLRYADTLLLGTGSHLEEVPRNRTGPPTGLHQGPRGGARSVGMTFLGGGDDIFERRAAELASFVSGAYASSRVVYLASSWGELHFSPTFTGPHEAEPKPHPKYSWDVIPHVNAEYTRAMRNRRFVVVDPSTALSRRRDCRKDYMHSYLGVYIGSTWRLLQAAFASL